jgi:hypothetical protein
MPKINDMEFSEYLYNAVTILPEAIQEEFVRVPADLAYWGEQYSVAVSDHLHAKNARETTHARLMVEKRAAAQVTGGKLTVGDLEAAVATDPTYQEVVVAEIEAEARKAAMRTRVDAVHAKKEMLISLGAQLRAEMGADPLTRFAGSK